MSTPVGIKSREFRLFGSTLHFFTAACCGCDCGCCTGQVREVEDEEVDEVLLDDEEDEPLLPLLLHMFLTELWSMKLTPLLQLSR